MKSSLEEEDIMCIICQEVPSNAHTSQCCGCVLCEDCQSSMVIENSLNRSTKSCPSCRNVNPNFQKNMYLIKLINKFPAICKYDCGHISQVSDIKDHYKTCDLRIFECKKCAFKDKRKEFYQHLFTKHEEEVLSIFDGTNKNVTTPQTEVQIDPILGVKNSNGDACHIGKSSKFYCGKNSGHKCTTCDGQCGPGDGCNCPSCMELDLKYRNIVGKKILINADGKQALFKNGTFHCCTITFDGTCGKGDYRCRYCKSLKGDLHYYKHLLQ